MFWVRIYQWRLRFSSIIPKTPRLSLHFDWHGQINCSQNDSQILLLMLIGMKMVCHRFRLYLKTLKMARLMYHLDLVVPIDVDISGWLYQNVCSLNVEDWYYLSCLWVGCRSVNKGCRSCFGVSIASKVNWVKYFVWSSLLKQLFSCVYCITSKLSTRWQNCQIRLCDRRDCPNPKLQFLGFYLGLREISNCRNIVIDVMSSNLQ